MKFASLYVQAEITKHMIATNQADLIRWMSASEGIGTLGTLQALMFESIAHEKLKAGGKFTYRELSKHP